MKSVSFYHHETGLFNGTHLVVSTESLVALNTPNDYIAIDGHFDSFSQRVDIASGSVVDYQPPAPSSDHVWDATKKRWVPHPAAAAKEKAERDARIGIAAFESMQHAAVRDFLLRGDKSKLEEIDAGIAALRESLT